MTDVFTKQKRSEIMSKIRCCNTKPEIQLKEALKGLYIRYQPKVYGKPDFANKTKKIAIFVDGCFWHKCPTCCRFPRSNTEYWTPKLERNVCRDTEINRILTAMGWMVFRIWEHEVKASPKDIAKSIETAIRRRDCFNIMQINGLSCK